MLNDNKNLSLIDMLKDTPWSNSTCDLEKYLDILFAYNQSYNLFSRKLTRRDVMLDHIYDSLLAEPHIVFNSKVIDIGSGGGFPALCLALVRSDLHFTLVEKSYRKCEFLKQAIKDLDLNKRVNVFHGNAADVKLEAFNVVTSRAMCSVKKLLDILGYERLKDKEVFMYKALLENIEQELKEADRPLNSKIIALKPYIEEKTRNLLHLIF